MSFSVVQREREIGVRKAIGASTREIVRLIVGGSAVLGFTGLGTGLVLAVVAGQLVRGREAHVWVASVR